MLNQQLTLPEQGQPGSTGIARDTDGPAVYAMDRSHSTRRRALPSFRAADRDRRALCSYYTKSARPPEAFRADLIRAQIARAAAKPLPVTRFAHAACLSTAHAVEEFGIGLGLLDLV